LTISTSNVRSASSCSIETAIVRFSPPPAMPSSPARAASWRMSAPSATPSPPFVPASITWRLGDLGTKHAMLLAGFGFGSLPAHMIADASPPAV